MKEAPVIEIIKTEIKDNSAYHTLKVDGVERVIGGCKTFTLETAIRCILAEIGFNEACAAVASSDNFITRSFRDTFA